MPYTYKIHHLPTSEPILLPFLAGKYSSLRLTALSLSPTSFSSTFALESSFTASQWITRLTSPSVQTFVAVAYSPDMKAKEMSVEKGDWVGCATLLGPRLKGESGSGGIGGDGGDVERKWQMCGVYNKPEHRGKGLAKMLIDGAVEFAAREAGMGRRSSVGIIIHHDNLAVKKLYDGLGFVDAGSATLMDALVANNEPLPEDGGASQPEKYLTQSGLVMIKVVEGK